MFPNGKPSFTANSDRLDRPGGGSRGRYRRSNRRWLFGRDAHKEDPFHPGQQDLDTGASCPCTACDHLDVCPTEPAEREKSSFVTVSGTLPLAVGLLAAAALGASVVLAVGTLRIVQLRKLVRRTADRASADGP